MLPRRHHSGGGRAYRWPQRLTNMTWDKANETSLFGLQLYKHLRKCHI